MGRSYTPKYRLEMVLSSTQIFPWKSAWNGGSPTEKNLEKYIYQYIESLKKGGANYHLTEFYGFMPIPNRAWIVNQKTGEKVAEWVHPPFLVI